MGVKKFKVVNLKTGTTSSKEIEVKKLVKKRRTSNKKETGASRFLKAARNL